MSVIKAYLTTEKEVAEYGEITSTLNGNKRALDVTSSAIAAATNTGNGYTAGVSSASLASAASISISFTTPNTTNRIHAIVSAQTSLVATLSILQAPTITVDSGTDLTIVNLDTNSSNTSTVSTIETVPEVGKATSGATITADGTTLVTAVTSAGVPYNPNQNEIILAQNTTYAFRLTSGAAANVASLTLNWYEAVTG